ncbi:MAG: nucleoid-associated protein YgaU [Bradymonadia bacterium]|jgi:nucleoid-associated protein YgaU
MKTLRHLFTLALLCAPTHGAHGQTPEPAEEPIDSAVGDARLQSAVLLRLAADPAVDARNYDVSVQSGAVTIVSRAATGAELSRAEQLARDAADGAPVSIEGAQPAEVGEASDAPLRVSLAQQYETYVALGSPSEEAFESVTDVADGSGTPSVARAASGDRPRTYTVQSGDNLSAIASRTMGDGMAWPRIFEMNRNVIGSNPNGLRTGMVLRIPQD